MFDENETWRKPRIKGNSQKSAIWKFGCFAKAISHQFRRAMKENGDE
jgi:hypothetical protein